MHLKLLSLGLLLSVPTLACAAEPATVLAAQASGGQTFGPSLRPTKPDDGKSMFGEPLYVNEKRVTDEDIKLWLIYGPCRLQLDMYKIGLILDDEIGRQAKEAAEKAIAAQEKEKPYGSKDLRGKAMADELKKQLSLLHEKYDIKDKEFADEYQDTIDDFHKTYPVLNIPAEISRAFRSVEWYGEQLRQTMLFDRVFLPANPDEWPAVTLESMRADTPGDIWYNDAKTSYEARKKRAEQNAGKLPKEDTIYLQLTRQIVRDAMFHLMDFRTAPDGIAPGLAFWADANGDGKPEVEVTIDQLWNKVADTVTPTEVAEAKQWFVTTMATRDRLEKDGGLLSPADCKKSIDEMTKGYEGGSYSLELLATKTYYFPSVENYVEYHCLREGFHKLIAAKLEPGPGGDISPALREYFDRANKVMGLGQVDCEVMLVSAMDMPNFKWKPDGWAKARTLANEVKAQIEQNQKDYNDQRAKAAAAQASGKEYKPEKEILEPYRFWSQMIDDHSEYWDPPAPEGPGKRGSDVGMKKRGRFGPKFRNDLINFVGENVYTEWVMGGAITDSMFFDQAENSVAGPFKGPLGYYLTRVNRRTPPTRPLNLAEPKHVELLRDDYLRWAFIQYAKEAVASAKLKGYTPL